MTLIIGLIAGFALNYYDASAKTYIGVFAILVVLDIGHGLKALSRQIANLKDKQ